MLVCACDFLTPNFEDFFLLKPNLIYENFTVYNTLINNIVPYCNRNQYLKNQMNRIIMKYKNVRKSACFKWMFGLSGNGYRVAMLPNCYWNHHAKFEIDRTIQTCLKYRKELTVPKV